MDPNHATREQFTNHIISLPLPENAAPDWRFYAMNHRSLLDKLAHHPAMALNLQQTYMTPAKSKNKIYFMWDFVGRTLGLLNQLDPTLPNSQKHKWSEVEGRAASAATLILDKMPGMLDEMVAQTDRSQAGQHPEFGEDILRLAREIENYK